MYEWPWHLRRESAFGEIVGGDLDLHVFRVFDRAGGALFRGWQPMSISPGKQNAVSFFVGFLFAIGLAVAGMTQPQKIIAFLDPWNWDPSLIFVMAGAVGIHIIAYPIVRRRASPLLTTKWHVPDRKDVTPRLILGSMLFGIGWGLGGFCPGPALASIASGDTRAYVFVGAMVVGMILFMKTEPYLRLRE